LKRRQSNEQPSRSDENRSVHSGDCLQLPAYLDWCAHWLHTATPETEVMSDKPQFIEGPRIEFDLTNPEHVKFLFSSLTDEQVKEFVAEQKQHTPKASEEK
jgi:hypothetical protein